MQAMLAPLVNRHRDRKLSTRGEPSDPRDSSANGRLTVNLEAFNLGRDDLKAQISPQQASQPDNDSHDGQPPSSQPDVVFKIGKCPYPSCDVSERVLGTYAYSHDRTAPKMPRHWL